MIVEIILRPALASDAMILLAWRNHPATRMASRDSREISTEEHLEWLARALSDSSSRIMIAERAGEPVGVVRARRESVEWEISWTVSPQVRGGGIGKKMVAMFSNQFKEPICAYVRVENIASTKIAEYAGMYSCEIRDGFVLYRRDERS